MFAAWWLPKFPLQALRLPPALCAGVLEAAPATTAVRGDARLACVSTRAEQAGVYAGMTVSQALARSPGFQARYRDEAAEQAMRQTLLTLAESWTPDYEDTRPGLCVLDLRHARLPAGTGWEDQARLMHEDLAAHGWEARAGLSDHPETAILAAHVATPWQILRKNQAAERRLLQTLPLETLQPSAAVAEILRLWGVADAGELAALPRAEVAARLGAEGLRLWELAQGGGNRLLRHVRAQESFTEQMELETGIECLEPLMHLLGGMLQRLCAKLASAWRVAAALRLGLRFADQSTHERELRVAEPTCDQAVLQRLLQGHLERVQAGAPVVAVMLETTPARPTARQGGLFEQGLKDPARFHETLSALESLLGRRHVGSPAPAPSHQPDAFDLRPLPLPAGEPAPGPGGAHALAHRPRGLPLLRFRPPQPAQVRLRSHRPALLRLGTHTVPVVESRGPWLLSGGWWDETLRWERADWDVAAEDGRLYRLSCQPGQWWVEGIYN